MPIVGLGLGRIGEEVGSPPPEPKFLQLDPTGTWEEGHAFVGAVVGILEVTFVGLKEDTTVTLLGRIVVTTVGKLEGNLLTVGTVVGTVEGRLEGDEVRFEVVGILVVVTVGASDLIV